MRTIKLGPSSRYIMDLETGISFPRDRATLNRAGEPGSRDLIRREAYSLWEAQGRPENCGLAHWLEAERQAKPTRPLPVRAMPAVRLDPRPDESESAGPLEALPAATLAGRVAGDGPSPLCREAAGDDVRDYAFHLYVQTGCAPDQKGECWREAVLCIRARVPETAAGKG